MLTKGDDYPLHQTPEPIAYVGGNRNFYDRYFFNGYDKNGDVFFAMALGVYPYVNILDAGFSVFKASHHDPILHSDADGFDRTGDFGCILGTEDTFTKVPRGTACLV